MRWLIDSDILIEGERENPAVLPWLESQEEVATADPQHKGLQGDGLPLCQPIERRFRMIKEHDCVVLSANVPDEGLVAGDVGTVVHIHKGGEGYEVEFMTLTGETVAIVTPLASQVRPLTRRPAARVSTAPPHPARNRKRSARPRARCCADT